MLLSEFGGPVFRLSFDSSANSLIVFHTINNLTLNVLLKNPFVFHCRDPSVVFLRNNVTKLLLIDCLKGEGVT